MSRAPIPSSSRFGASSNPLASSPMELASTPLAGAPHQSPKTPSHWRNEPSLSTQSTVPNFHLGPSSVNSTVHHAHRHEAAVPLDAMATESGGVSRAVSPRSSSSMPVEFVWPDHTHPLQYAGMVGTDGSVSVCQCRSCGSEHYNTAVYSCLEHGCHFHLCLACAIQHTQTQQQPQPTLLGSGKKSKKRNSLASPSNTVPAAGSGGRDWIAPGSASLCLSSTAPLRYDKAKLKREAWTLRRYVHALEADADTFAMRIAVPCALHPAHPLLFFPVSPNELPLPLTEHELHHQDGQGDGYGSTQYQHKRPHPHSASLPAGLFCDAVQSDMCASYDLTKRSRPMYACRSCNYRLCLPCFRSYLGDLQSQLQHTVAAEQARETAKEIERCSARSRAVDLDSRAHHELVGEHTAHLVEDARRAQLLIGAAVVYALLLINAMLTQASGSGFAYALLCCAVIAIAALLPAVMARALCRTALGAHRALAMHARCIEAIYSHPSLNSLLEPVETPTVSVARLQPMERELLLNLYHHQAEYQREQRKAAIAAPLGLVSLMSALALVSASLIYLFTNVICSLPAYAVEVSECEIRSGVPVGICVFLAFLYPLVWRLIGVPVGGVQRRTEDILNQQRERKRASKRARMDYSGA